MKVEVIKGVSHSIELIHGETSVCITPDEAQNLIAQLRAVVPVTAGFQEAAENSEIIFSTDGELTIYSFVGAPRWWATIREAEEALSVFKAGMLAERERLMKEAVEIEVSNVGILQMGSILTDKGIFARDTIQVIIIKKEK